MDEYRLDVHRLQVSNDGWLPKGNYYYRVSAIVSGGNVDLANTLKVYAPHQDNSIGLFWDEVPDAEAYRVYRRGEDGIEGSVLIAPPAFFYDNGMVVFE